MSTPTITAISASFGNLSGGDIITITGAQFAAGVIVLFGTTPATGVVLTGTTSIACITPAHAAGVVSIVVTNTDTGTVTLPYCFTFIQEGIYHKVTDVQGELRSMSVTDTSIITGAQMQKFITATEADVSGVLWQKYVIPISATLSPQSYSVVQKICILLTVDRVINILRNNGLPTPVVEEGNRAASLYKRAMDKLDSVMKEDTVLTDALRAVNDVTNTIQFPAAPDASNPNNGVVQKGVKQW